MCQNESVSLAGATRSAIPTLADATLDRLVRTILTASTVWARLDAGTLLPKQKIDARTKGTHHTKRPSGTP